MKRKPDHVVNVNIRGLHYEAVVTKGWSADAVRLDNDMDRAFGRILSVVPYRIRVYLKPQVTHGN